VSLWYYWFNCPGCFACVILPVLLKSVLLLSFLLRPAVACFRVLWTVAILACGSQLGSALACRVFVWSVGVWESDCGAIPAIYWCVFALAFRKWRLALRCFCHWFGYCFWFLYICSTVPSCPSSFLSLFYIRLSWRCLWCQIYVYFLSDVVRLLIYLCCTCSLVGARYNVLWEVFLSGPHNSSGSLGM
jgi:hypothetical protein